MISIGHSFGSVEESAPETASQASSWSNSQAGQLALNGSCSQDPPYTPNVAWQKGITVRVNIDPKLKRERRTAVEKAFINWQESEAGKAAEIHFNFQSTREPISGDYTYQITVADHPLSNGRYVTNRTAKNGAGVSAVTLLNPKVTNPTALAETMAAAIGGTFGLELCPHCAPGSSVMIPARAGEWRPDKETGLPNDLRALVIFDPNETTSGRLSPSACDVRSAIAAGGHKSGDK